MQNQPPERSQAKSIGYIAIVNAANAVIGIAQAFAVGILFGTTPPYEVFLVASAFYQSMTKLLQAGQIAEIFIPIYHQLKEAEGPGVAFNLLGILVNWMVLASAVFSIFLYLSAQFLIPFAFSGLSPDLSQTCIAMFQLLIPLISLQILQAMLSNLLTSEKLFVAQEVTRAVCGILSLAIIIVFAKQYDAWVMVGAQWVSLLVMVIVFSFFLYQIGYRHCFRLRHDKFEISEIFRKLPSIFGYVCVTQLYALIVTGGLTLLPQGSIAVYNYAGRLFSRISGILIRPVSTVFFSHFSSAVSEGNKSVQNITTKALRLALLLSTLTGAFAISTGLPALRALWLSPKFPESQIFQTYIIFSVLCFLPVFNGLALIFRKMNMTHQYTHSQYMILIVNQIIGAATAYFLIPALGLTGAVVLLFGSAVLGVIGSGSLLKVTFPARFTLYDRATITQCLTLFTVTVVPLLLLQHGTSFYEWFPASRIGYLAATAVLASLAILIIGVTSNFLQLQEYNSCKRIVFGRLKSLAGGTSS